ncbi:MAG TPA: hypothetical protein VFP77_00420, partial [Gemmatimonadaceae bacterium]|nr:hypothetical protein [Gemmatimonadaceae bacterium]
SGGIGAVSIGVGALLMDLLLPLAGNLMLWRPARRSRLATLLRRVHLITLAAAFYVTLAGSLLFPGVLAGLQFAILASAYLVVATQIARTSG